MTADQEAAYEQGVQAGLTRALRLLLREIGPAATSEHRLLLERAETVAMLRLVCAAHGDNEWSDELHLADIIDKHLARIIPDIDRAIAAEREACARIVESEPCDGNDQHVLLDGLAKKLRRIARGKDRS